MTERPVCDIVAKEQPHSPARLDSRPSLAIGLGRVWEPGLWVRLPRLGLASLLVALFRRFSSVFLGFFYVILSDLDHVFLHLSKVSADQERKYSNWSIGQDHCSERRQHGR